MRKQPGKIPNLYKNYSEKQKHPGKEAAIMKINTEKSTVDKKRKRPRSAMRRLKSLTLALPLLLCMTMVSVGFSSWMLLRADPKTVTGSFGVYGVSNSTDLIYMYGDVDVFDYKAESFVDKDGKPTDVGKITVPYRVNIDKCKDTYGNSWGGSLDLHLTLRAENVREVDGGKLFDTSKNNTQAHDSYKYSYAISVAVNGVEKPITSNDGTAITLDTRLTDLGSSGVKEISVVYTFAIPKNLVGSQIPANFKHCFGKYLQEAGEGRARTVFFTTAWVENAG